MVTRVLQTVLEPPHGNALQACAASILGKALDGVPNFVEADDYWQAMLDHASSIGLSVIKMPLTDGKLPFPSASGTFCIARGTSPRGAHGHVIVAAVAADGVSLSPVHDPHPDGGFLSGHAVWAAFYVPFPDLINSEATLSSSLLASGFDLLTPMRVSWYNDFIKRLGLSTDSTAYLEKSGEAHASGEAAPFALKPLEDYGRPNGDCLAFLVGNSKAMWPKFLKWLDGKQDPMGVSDPVDTYTSEAITKAFQQYAGGGDMRFEIFWASDMSPSRLVDMNRAALVSNLCHFSDEMFLSIHPTFGSWVAFRAVVVVDMPASVQLAAEAPPHLPSLLTEEETADARVAFAEALKASSEVEMSVDGMPLHLAHKWEALRDCVGVGREHKYSRLQSEYHYTKDRKLLERALAEMREGNGMLEVASEKIGAWQPFEATSVEACCSWSTAVSAE